MPRTEEATHKRPLFPQIMSKKRDFPPPSLFPLFACPATNHDNKKKEKEKDVPFPPNAARDESLFSFFFIFFFPCGKACAAR